MSPHTKIDLSQNKCADCGITNTYLVKGLCKNKCYPKHQARLRKDKLKHKLINEIKEKEDKDYFDIPKAIEIMNNSQIRRFIPLTKNSFSEYFFDVNTGDTLIIHVSRAKSKDINEIKIENEIDNVCTS